MLSATALSTYLSELLPGQGISDSCPNGLQVEGKPTLARLATAVSASLQTIEAAIERQADALIVHHGLFWSRDSFVIQGVKRKKLALLMQHDLSLFAYHLPLDLHASLGNNWKAALDLKWTDLKPFGLFNGIPIGVRGRIPSCSRQELRHRLEEYYQHPAICAWGGPEEIQTIGLVSGGAYKLLPEAAQEGLDAFITGSFDEPVWYQAQEEKINFFALGHSATECIGPLALAEHLEQHFQIPCSFLRIENPF